MHATDHPRPDPHAWRSDAACRGMDPAIFIPAKDGHAIRAIAQAKAVCAVCPVIEDCRREHADEPLGVWFGTTPDERGNPVRFDSEHCGTNAGYRRHYRAGEPPCRPCNAAFVAYRREYRARKREAS